LMIPSPWSSRRCRPAICSVYRKEQITTRINAETNRPSPIHAAEKAAIESQMQELKRDVAVKLLHAEVFGGADRRERFLWIWGLVQLVVVSLSADKHKHYIMPALPIFSILAGRTLAAFHERVRRQGRLLGPTNAAGFSAACLIGGIVAFFILDRKWPHLREPALAASLMLAFGGCAVFTLIGFRRHLAAIGSAGGLFLAIYMVTVGWIIPGRDHRFLPARFARSVRQSLPEGQDVCVFAMGQAPEVYYLEEPVFRAESAERLQKHLQRRRELLLVTSGSRIDELRKLGRPEVLKQMPPRPEWAHPQIPPLVFLRLTPDDNAPASPQRVERISTQPGASTKPGTSKQ